MKDGKVECIGADGKIYKRQPCQIFTRVMGYMRNVGNFNIGKKSEFYSRKYFDEKLSMISMANRQFVSSYS